MVTLYSIGAHYLSSVMCNNYARFFLSTLIKFLDFLKLLKWLFVFHAQNIMHSSAYRLKCYCIGIYCKYQSEFAVI